MANKVCLHGGDITPCASSSSTNGASFTEQGWWHVNVIFEC